MTTPTSGPISMTNVETELDIYLSDDYLMSGFYGIAPNTGGAALMFHNLEMASGNATTAKVAIFDNYNAGTNYKLTNWYNYTRDVDVVMTYSITNNSAYGVNPDLVIWDMTDANVGLIYTGTIAASASVSGTSSGPLALTNIGSSGYRIAIQNVSFDPPPAAPPPFPPSPPTTFAIAITIDSASDTDGVGGGTTRTTYGPFAYSQSAPGGITTPFPTKVVDTSGNLIAINKRTSVTITFT